MDGAVTLNKQLLSGVLLCETVSWIPGWTDDKHSLGLLILRPPSASITGIPSFMWFWNSGLSNEDASV